MVDAGNLDVKYNKKRTLILGKEKQQNGAFWMKNLTKLDTYLLLCAHYAY